MTRVTDTSFVERVPMGIETAPKDGTQICVFFKKLGWQTVSYTSQLYRGSYGTETEWGWRGLAVWIDEKDTKNKPICWVSLPKPLEAEVSA